MLAALKMAKLNVSENVEDLCTEFASFVENIEKSAVANNGMFTVGLSGGSSATIVAKALSDKSLTWEKWHVFFCDERFVPLTGMFCPQYLLAVMCRDTLCWRGGGVLTN